ncbi:MAG: helix-hairpin-helix domain-containing protein [candidate division WOR-3 bacterium]
MGKLLLLFWLLSVEPFEIEEEITNTPEFLERIRRLEENPININNARKDELLLVPYLDSYLVDRIIKYREKHPFLKKEELLLIEGITPYLFDRIKKFFVVEDKKQKRHKDSEFLLRFERKISSPQSKVYNKVILPYKGIFLNALFEKDWKEEKPSKYYAFSIYIPEKLIIGNYDLDLGMGIIMGKPDFFYRGGSIPGEKGFSPHLSTYKENYLRGITCEWKNLIFFSSYNKIETLGKEKLLGLSYKTSTIRVTGSFSEAEKNGKNILTSFYMVKDLGGNIFRLELGTGGGDFPKLKKNLSYSMGIDNGRGLKAIYVNIKDSLPTIRNSPFQKDKEVFYLSYTRNISPIFSIGLFSEFSRNISNFEPFNKIGEIHLSFTPIKNLTLENRIKAKIGQKNYRLDAIYKINEINLKTRFEALNGKEGSGFLTYLILRHSKNFIFEGGLILYEIANWESRIYEYENDLPGKFTIKQLYGSGKRLYFLLGEKLLPFKIHLKWGIDFKEEISHELGIAFLI